MGKALKIRDELSAEALRRAARRKKDGRAAARMYAIAHALDGLSRAEAARLAGMERQALRDAVVRYNAEGLAGLHDRPKGRPRRRLDAKEEAELVAAIERGPDPDVDGCCAWTRADLCRWLEASTARPTTRRA
jgi:transposase